ncbi:MAG: methyltransferase domain-containing protein [Solirubrobacteraceae bacterium]
MTHPRAPRYLLTAEVGHPFIPLVRRLIEEQAIRSVCDFGGGANPVLSLDDIQRLGLRYVVVDASAEELAKTPPSYRTRTADVTAAPVDLGGERFDLVVSKFLAEHVEDPAAFHSAVWNALRPAGFAVHFFPTLPSPPFVANRVLMGRQSRRLIDFLQPGFREQGGGRGKFPAYYRWCEGPTQRQYRRFASLGFEVVDYVVLVGHRYYVRAPAIQRAADAVSRRTIRLQRPAFSTYACVVLRRSPA